MIDLAAARFRWHPIAASSDLVPRHVFHAQLLGRELALWRADDGNVNAWENRCLHRGVRLSIGINDGTELVCQYHGWRYANRTAGCTYIPAHPADAPARTICNNTYPVIEKYGLIWCGETPEGELSDQQLLLGDSVTALRAITVNAPLQDIALPLINRYSTDVGVNSTQDSHYGIDTPNQYFIRMTANYLNRRSESQTPDIAFFLQPLDSARTTIRGVLCGTDRHSTDHATLTAMLRQNDDILCQLRDSIERRFKQQPQPAPWTPIIRKVSEAIATIPSISTSGRKAAMRVRVTAVDTLSANIKAFSLQAVEDPQTGAPTVMPAGQPGAHIDVHLPNALVRQYSLINGPGQTDHYAIAVKQLDDSTGGSRALHQSIKVGDVLAISLPRNNFSLRRDAEHTHLIAGGIGLTPLLSMARALHHAKLPFTLHHFIGSESDRIFSDELAAMHGSIHVHVALNAQQTQAKLSSLLATPHEHHHVYICGPSPMLGFARESAAGNGWSDESVHFEYFKNTEIINKQSVFSVELARSGLTLDVPSGKTLLSVLRAHDVGVPSSCEQGACGTCRISVLEGEPDHQDVYLSDSEKRKGDCLMSCVSRAKSARLVLDL